MFVLLKAPNTTGAFLLDKFKEIIGIKNPDESGL